MKIKINVEVTPDKKEGEEKPKTETCEVVLTSSEGFLDLIDTRKLVSLASTLNDAAARSQQPIYSPLDNY